MPNCYYVSSSSPGQIVRDLKACVASVGGPGDVQRYMTDGGKVHAWVYYAELRDAMRFLNPVKSCMEEKGHRIWKAEILHEFDEVGLTEED